MIPKIRYGTGSTYGLIRCLFGAGKRDEHTNNDALRLRGLTEVVRSPCGRSVCCR